MVLRRMGLLDDAIREHLELKRRRGADPDEVAREQREALDTDTAPGDQGDAPAEDGGSGQVSGGPLVDPGPQASPASPPGDEAPTASPEPSATAEPSAPPTPVGATMGETAELDMSSVLGEDVEHEVSTGSVAPVRAETDALDWEMPGDAQAVEEEPDEDVLEETPDFLRETPEQERLWFEQRPPRDFDFDK
jgi:hypothetical protein